MTSFKKSLIVLISFFLIVITYFLYSFLDTYQSQSIFEQNLEERMFNLTDSKSATKVLSNQSFSDTQNHYSFINENGSFYMLRINIENNTLSVYDLTSIQGEPVLISETPLE